MVRYFLIVLITILLQTAFCQEKVDWTYSFDNTNDELVMSATLDAGWHIYSLHVNQDIGPIATSFTFEKNKSVRLKGDVIEPQPLEDYDENFGGNLTYFEKSVTFRQKVKVKKSTELKGTVTYMLCNDTMCLPPVDEEFVITIEK